MTQSVTCTATFPVIERNIVDRNLILGGYGESVIGPVAGIDQCECVGVIDRHRHLHEHPRPPARHEVPGKIA